MQRRLIQRVLNGKSVPCTVSIAFLGICFNWTSRVGEDYRSRASASLIFAAKNRMGMGLKEGSRCSLDDESCASNGGVLVGMNEPFFSFLLFFFFLFFFLGIDSPSRSGKRDLDEEKKIGREPTMNRFMIELNSSVLSLWGELSII